MAIMNARSLFHDLYARLTTFLENGESRTIAYLLLAQICNITREDVIAGNGVRFTGKAFSKLDRYISRLKNHEPIQYILGRAVFYGREFKVDQNVLIPRPETEELVDLVIREANNRSVKILDVGTGSGCIAITLALNLSQADVYAIDSKSDILSVAIDNGRGLNASVTFWKADIFEDAFEHEFDIIVSNPPYVLESEKSLMNNRVLLFEPVNALFVPDNDPLIFYERIIHISQDHLRIGGNIYFEINEKFGSKIKLLLENSSFKNVSIRKDINQNDRFAIGEK